MRKYNSNGDFQWERTWGGFTVDIGYGVEIDVSDNIIVSGYQNNGTVAFLTKYDPVGNVQWIRTWGGAEEAQCVAVATHSNVIYATGFTDDGFVEFAPVGAPCYNESDVREAFKVYDFVVKYLTDGCW